jgi:hypothetical protein
VQHTVQEGLKDMSDSDTKIVDKETFMKKLISLDVFWIVTVISVVFFTIAITSMWSKWCTMETTKKAIEMGYSQQMFPGEGGSYWVKPTETPKRPAEAGVQ